MAETELPVIVIGAGAAGLAAADALGRRGIAATIIEREAQLAMPWRRRHERLTLNTHRDLSYLPGAPFPAGTPAFPRRQAIVAYLEKFATDRALPVEFATTVKRVEPGEEGWIVHTDRGTRKARAVIVATGRDSEPWRPHWEGEEAFAGSIVHAAAFGQAGDYDGKRVLVAGAGNSGFDVLNHLAAAKPQALWLSARGGPSILPKRIGKVAVHRFGRITAALPPRLADFVIAGIQRTVFGDLRRYGLPPAPKGGASRLTADQIAIAVDDGAVKALKAGRITVVAPIARFTPRGVVLSDGREIDLDVVIAATGYRTGLEDMVGHLDVLDGRGTPKANGAELTGQPGLWFIGMRPSLVSYFDAAGRQAAAIAAAISKA